MRTHNIQIRKGFRWLGALMGVSFLALAACSQTMQQAAPTQPAKAYVGNFKDNTMSVIDTDAISPNGKLAYVTVQEPGHFGLALIDLATRSVVRTLALDKTPRDGEFGYDGKVFYFTQAGLSSVQVLDPASDRIVAQIPTGVSPHFVSYPRGSAFGIVVVQGPSELLLFDPATNKPARSIAVGKQPHWATASGDGKTAYVTNEGSNDVTVVNLATGKTATVAVGNAPRKVVVQRTAATVRKES